VRRCLFLALLASLPWAAAAEAAEGPSPKDVHKAVQAGAEWLKAQYAGGFEGETWHSTPELVALTFSHAGIAPKDKVFARCLQVAVESKLEFTYRVSTLAMALSKINPYKYRAKLAHCAQWLVDTQLAGGEWGYPGAVQGRTDATRSMKVEPPALPKEEGPVRPGKEKPVVIARRTDPEKLGGAKGDFSNTQFALLGLRACRDARIEVPKETWQAALDYTLQYQQEDGSWGYVKGGEQDVAGYASLTCAGMAGIAICQHALGRSPRSHPAIKKGVAWLKKNWTPSENAGIENSALIPPSTWQMYHLYSVERAGRILNLKKLGKHKWYPEGATWLLGHQRGDGSWRDPGGDTSGADTPYLKVADTCFAILFLTLSTPPLTGG
jgi:hypothetical protein